MAQSSCCSVRARKWPWPRQSGRLPADPGIEDAPAVELHVVAEAAHEIRELGLGLAHADFVRDLEGDRHDRAGVIGERRIGQQDEMRASLQAPHDLRRRLLPGELAEEFFDVLDLERALFELVL